MRGIALNFFPLKTHDFTITLHCLPFVEGEQHKVGDEEAIKRNLEVDGIRNFYWTLFQPIKDSREVVCEPFNNSYATIEALRRALIQSCNTNLDHGQFRITSGFKRGVEIIIATHAEGTEVVLLEPYLLRSKSQFGFLADFRFHPAEAYRRTRRALQISLSLDRYGKPNPNYYADRYSQIVSYIEKFHKRISLLELPRGQRVAVESQLVELPANRLVGKKYIIGSGSESNSQFMGVKQKGPLNPCVQDTHLYFLYRQEDRSLSHDLFRSLRGDIFNTFNGMERMFQFPVSNEHVSGAALLNFSVNEIHRVRDRVVKDAAGRNVVPIVVTPFSRHDSPKENATYWNLKHAFLTAGLPIQVVANVTIADKSKLKWSVAGIGLQIFAKAGGKPWKVRPETKNCLIVGIGQAHQKSEDRIDRYFAYSVLTDSSGVFEEIKVLGEHQNEEHYLKNFSASLRSIFTQYSSRFSNFVVHATFTIRRCELESIATVLAEQQKQAERGKFISIKFNDRNRFFGFAIGHNSRVPYESTMISLSNNEFLVWFEGLQYDQSVIRGRIGRPLYVEFLYPPSEKLSQDEQRAYLQDAINLSGANWRGFNAKSLPVSVYYAQLIAKYLKEFERHGLPPVDIGRLTPWFL